ncbi:hypothetical protein Ct9H90mP29_02820 [bacterium]|nr:MAG: hypothetical protein Ct9H90mP29_02820 [bacterium]
MYDLIILWVVPFTTPIAGALGTILTVLMSVISSFVVGFNVMVFRTFTRRDLQLS